MLNFAMQDYINYRPRGLSDTWPRNTDPAVYRCVK